MENNKIFIGEKMVQTLIENPGAFGIFDKEMTRVTQIAMKDGTQFFEVPFYADEGEVDDMPEVVFFKISPQKQKRINEVAALCVDDINSIGVDLYLDEFGDDVDEGFRIECDNFLVSSFKKGSLRFECRLKHASINLFSDSIAISTFTPSQDNRITLSTPGLVAVDIYNDPSEKYEALIAKHLLSEDKSLEGLSFEGDEGLRL